MKDQSMLTITTIIRRPIWGFPTGTTQEDLPILTERLKGDI